MEKLAPAPRAGNREPASNSSPAPENVSTPTESQLDVIAAAEKFIRRFCVLPDSAYLPLATWAVATQVPDAFDAFPYIALLSPAKRCGKTRLLEVLELLSAKPQRVTTISSASLFRMMKDVPTLLLDEVEALRNMRPSDTSQAILAILNAGHRKGATVTRCDGADHKVRHFPVYGPKVFAAIGGLPDTLADRSIVITMQRRISSQQVDRFLQGRAKIDVQPLGERLAEWASGEGESVRSVYESMTDLTFLSDRDADIWMPLFAVCSVAAPGRVDELRQCSKILSGAKAADDVEDSQALKLLADIRAVWTCGAAHITTEVLLQRVKAIAESPWAGIELNPRGLAKMLRPFGAAPRQVRNGSETVKGYLRSGLRDAFSRYLPPDAGLAETGETTSINTGEATTRYPKQRLLVSPYKGP
jgi:hypothetical protein